MLYIKPYYYHKFKCTADKCEATCCAGWQIVIDEESMVRYDREQSAYGKVLRERVDWEEGVFKQDACKRCAFLNPDNLCDMYKHLGEESLCVTCTNYPRHIEEFENIREMTLSISCPEVARIILEQKEPVTFVEEEIESQEEEFEDYDPFLYSYLEDARKIILSILQNRDLHISVRAALVKEMAEEMQECLQTSELFELVDLFEKYEDAKFLANAARIIADRREAFYRDADNAYAYSKAVFSRLYELEHLSDEWEPYLEQCWAALYGEKAAGYQVVHESFRTWCAKGATQKPYNLCLPERKQCSIAEQGSVAEPSQQDSFELDTVLEQLLVYFIFTYFCGAVYDDNVLGKVQMSLDSVYNIYEMFVAKWTEQGQKLTMKDMERIVYRYSRELEHSDVNLELMEEIQ